jgi:hypothetical protein
MRSAQLKNRTGDLSGVGKRFPFPDDGEAARVQRRAIDVFGEEPTHAKSLVSEGRFS